jgi:hypothetical protein
MSTDAQLLEESTKVIQATPARLRMFGTPHPRRFTTAAWVLLGLGVVIAVVGAAAGGLPYALLGLITVLPAASFGWTAHVSRGREQEVRRYRKAHMDEQDVSVRKHPVLWAVGVPVSVVLVAAGKFGRGGQHHGRTAWLIALGLALLFGLGVSAYVQWHARRPRP